jgi:hypothetical protein
LVEPTRRLRENAGVFVASIGLLSVLFALVVLDFDVDFS